MAQRYATIAEVRLRLGPAFSDPPITDAVVQMYLDDTACFIAPAVWGQCASQAHAYAAAHCIVGSPYAAGLLAPGSASLQLLAGEANGPASRTFSVPGLDDADGVWALTAWGRKFLEYRRTRHGKGSAVLARTARSLPPVCGRGMQ